MSTSARRIVARTVVALAATAIVPAFAGCPEPDVPTRGKAARSAVATKWLKRANEEYRSLDLEEANESIGHAKKAAAGDSEIALLSARIALGRLDFKGALASLEGVEGTEATSLRARAFWYDGDLPHAAEEISKALEDPDFKDPWAKPIRELSGTQGSGRHPFSIRDGAARKIELRMPHDLGTALLVPVEIDGQQTTAVVVTGVPEVVLDSRARTNPGWVSIKFTGAFGSIEMRDVPAMVQDLSAYTANQTVAVGALIGTNMLRRLHVTIDRRADQFIIRRDDPPPPPAMSKVPVAYVKGGGMVLRSTVRKEFEFSSGVWLNSGEAWTLALPDPSWKKLGIDVKDLRIDSGVTHGKLTDMRLGAFDVGPIEALANVPSLDEKLKPLDEVELMGGVGAGFLAAFRVTLADGGRTMWLETDEDTSYVLAPPVPVAPAPATSGSTTPAASASASPAASASAKAAPSTSAKPASAAPSTKPATTAPSTKPAVVPPAKAPAPSASAKPAPSAGK